MKLIHPNINESIIFDGCHVNSIIIENKKFFRAFIEDIALQIDGFTGKAILSIDNVPVEMRKYAELISEFVPFDINRKSILSKINQAIEQISLREDKYMLTAELLQRIESYISDLAFDFPCDILMTKLSMGNIIKSIGLEIADDSASMIEKVFNYMELVCEFDKNKLFIMVNMRNYFTDEEMELFCRTIIEHDMRVLLIESHEMNRLSMENRLIIDEDLCEI